MSIFDRFIEKIAPHDCLGCGREGGLLCAVCLVDLPGLPPRCYRCGKLSPQSLTCPMCRVSSRLHRVQAGTTYAGLGKDLVWQLKLAGAQSATRVMARRMAGLLGDTAAGAVVVPVPTATSRTRQRGYDQAKLLAHELARQSRLPYADCLARSGQAHQHGSSRRERLRQLAGAFRVTRPYVARGAHVILVDDVVTTGSTLEAAAAVLRDAGAQHVEAIVFAQP